MDRYPWGKWLVWLAAIVVATALLSAWVILYFKFNR